MFKSSVSRDILDDNEFAQESIHKVSFRHEVTFFINFYKELVL